MGSRGTFFLIALIVLAACRKNDEVFEEPSGTPATVPVTFERNVPGSMYDAAWGPGATCFALMSPVIPYNVWQLVKLEAAGEAMPQFAPSWSVAIHQRFACATDDGGCMSTATHDDYLVVARLDASGALVDSRNYSFPGYETPTGITRIGPDVWVVSGYRQYAELIDSVYHVRQDIWAMAVNIDGDSLWKRAYSDEHMRWPMRTVGLANGDVLITSSYGTGSSNVGSALRVNALGDQVWSHDIGPAASYGLGACETPTGDLLFAACEFSEPSTFQGALYATTPAGTPLWQRRFGDEDADVWPVDVATDDAGNIVVVGRYTDEDNSERRLYVAGFSGDGQLVWERYAANNDTISEGKRVMSDASGHFRMIGSGYPRPNGTVYNFTFQKGVSSEGNFD